MGPAEMLFFFTWSGPHSVSLDPSPGTVLSVTLTSPTGDTILVGKYFCHRVMTEAEQWCLPI